MSSWSVVDQDVQRAYLPCGLSDARRVGDVQDEQTGTATDLPGSALSARGVAGAHIHREASGSELTRDLLANALAGTRDQGN